MIGTELLAKIFDELVRHNAGRRVIRRLYAESGQTGRKTWLFVAERTRTAIEELPNEYRPEVTKIQVRTLVMTLEALAACRNARLISRVYESSGGDGKKAVKYCAPRYKSFIKAAIGANNQNTR